jgi:hypothetical protein
MWYIGRLLLSLLYRGFQNKCSCKAPGDQVRSKKLHLWTWSPGALLGYFWRSSLYLITRVNYADEGFCKAPGDQVWSKKLHSWTRSLGALLGYFLIRAVYNNQLISLILLWFVFCTIRPGHWLSASGYTFTPSGIFCLLLHTQFTRTWKLDFIFLSKNVFQIDKN